MNIFFIAICVVGLANADPPRILLQGPPFYPTPQESLLCDDSDSFMAPATPQDVLTNVHITVRQIVDHVSVAVEDSLNPVYIYGNGNDDTNATTTDLSASWYKELSVQTSVHPLYPGFPTAITLVDNNDVVHGPFGGFGSNHTVRYSYSN